MNKSLKKLAWNIFAGINIHHGELTNKNKLQSLLNKLRPVCSDKELIRMGPKRDGGYLVPNDLDGIEACFSPGVGCSSAFEKDCAERGIKVFLADGFVEKPRLEHKLFHFTRKNLGILTNENFMTIDDWVAVSLPDSQGDLLLQMDIEGAEYEVLLGASDKLLKRFRIILVEFHHLNGLWDNLFFQLVSRMFEKLLQTHTCVHNHPNNYQGSVKIKNMEIPLVTELTFLRNDRVSGSSFAKIFPHPLDADNSKNNPSLVLPKCWYKQGNVLI
jgi:hypothetical protein